MTALERRREGRYRRRKAAREAKKAAQCAGYDDFRNISRYRSLFGANRKSMRNVTWKASVQRYQMNLLRNMEETREKLDTKKNITKGFVEFDLMERGHLRHIRSVHYTERVVQRSACDNSLVPMLRRGLIYDNGACLEGKGVDRSMDRMEAHLQQFFRANGFSNDGVALLFDFSGYFDNILHRHCFAMYSREYRDAMILWLLGTFVIPFGYPFSATGARRTRAPENGAEYNGKSLGLGSQVSQITAVSYPSGIDHYIKQVLRVRWYGRYMDDGYMLFRTKEEAVQAAKAMAEQCAKIGIKLNTKKTRIVKIKSGVKFLKTRFILTETGKVKRKMCRQNITKQRRKLKKFAAKKMAGEMTLEEIASAYCSWKGYALRRGGKMAARRMDALFSELFGIQAPKCKIKKTGRKKTWKTKTSAAAKAA